MPEELWLALRGVRESKGDVGQPSDLDKPSNQMQAARDEDVDGLVARRIELADDVDRMLDRGQDVYVVFRE